MAFPTTGVLDSFNAGASQNLTARTGWNASSFLNGKTTFVTDGAPTQARATGGTAAGGNYWTLGIADMEAYCTMIAVSIPADQFELAVRITSASASVPTYYALMLGAIGVASDEFELYKVVAGTPTNIGASIATTVSTGDAIGIDVVGSTLHTYYKASGGSWVTKHTVTDSSITGAGDIGFQHLFAQTCTIDDFGGGAPVSASPTSHPLLLAGVGG